MLSIAVSYSEITSGRQYLQRFSQTFPHTTFDLLPQPSPSINRSNRKTSKR
jgi:hypothetical protein